MAPPVARAPSVVVSVPAVLVVLALAVVPGASAEEDFDSGDIAPGASWSMTFTQPFPDGYLYHCHPHPWMQAMVHVQPDSDGVTEEVAVDILEPEDPDAWGYSVEHLVVEVGDTVTWTNAGAVVHTVTRMAEGGGDHDHGDHDHGDDDPGDDGNDAPGLPVLGVLAGLATVLLLRRR